MPLSGPPSPRFTPLSPSPLRAQVIAVLEQAGYRNSEDSLPVHSSGGTFSATGGSAGVNVTWRRWDASEDEIGELRVGIAAALRAAGLDVHELGTRIFVSGGGLEDAEPAN
ncbi:MAG TPA: hypothetical protein VJ418_30675 [Streptosporangiaceae bacterium]|nr:hypothetical protein [Streptosporangiaceae bacterium]